MSSFEVITLIISTLFFISSVVAVFVYVRVKLAELHIRVCSLEKQSVNNSIKMLSLEKEYVELNEKLYKKIDELKSIIISKLKQ